MAKEIKNNPQRTREIANVIGEFSNKSIPKANGESEVSNDGLTARFSDAILNLLDNDLKDSFQKLMSNSKQKFSLIADDFEKTDNNVSI